jgi:divalent metal cation (Fe/Co/Zn/Cd) transporter
MKEVIRFIASTIIALTGLAIASFSVYEAIQPHAQWLEWLGVALIGVGFAASGIVLAMYGLKRFIRAIVFFFTSYPELY